MDKSLKYPNLTIFFSILFLTYLFIETGALLQWITALGNFGYLSAFLIGIFFVSTFTVIPATAALFLLSGKLGIIAVSLLAGMGGAIGDFTIFKFIKDGLVSELKLVFKQVAGDNLLRFHWIFHTKYFVWLSPVIGALIIASPLPDELGIGLLGVYKLDDKKFILLSFILNTLGIFLILSGAQSVAQLFSN